MALPARRGAPRPSRVHEHVTHQEGHLGEPRSHRPRRSRAGQVARRLGSWAWAWRGDGREVILVLEGSLGLWIGEPRPLLGGQQRGLGGAWPQGARSVSRAVEGGPCQQPAHCCSRQARPSSRGLQKWLPAVMSCSSAGWQRPSVVGTAETLRGGGADVLALVCSGGLPCVLLGRGWPPGARLWPWTASCSVGRDLQH